MNSNRFRIYGIKKTTGKKVYMNYSSYKGQTFYSFNTEPTRFKNIEHGMFIELQIMAQSELINIIWECENANLQKRRNIASKSANRTV